MSTFRSSTKLLAFVLVALLATFCSRVSSESVRETETWIPPESAHDAASTNQSSGDFGFVADDYYDDEDYLYEDDVLSGSGTEPSSPARGPDTDNKIPERAGPTRPATDDWHEAPIDDNEIRPPPSRAGGEPPSNVLMSHAGRENGRAGSEVLAALICGGGVGLTLAILLVVLLLHRMKKKDEGSYELGKKPIYTKAPSAEIYA
ncbi:syndecan-4 [Stigmatopora argus]